MEYISILKTNTCLQKAFLILKFVKKTQKIKALKWTFGISFGVMVEITDIICGLLSKHLFQKMQQYGSSKKNLG